MTIVGFQDAYRKIRPSIVGLGFRNDPEFEIIGSGFIVHQSGWIMTNKHVLEAFLTSSKDGRVGLHSSAAAFFFIKAAPEEGFASITGMVVTNVIESASPPPKQLDYEGNNDKIFRGLKPRQILPPEPPDIGVCKFDINNVPKEMYPYYLQISYTQKKFWKELPSGF